MTISLWCVLVAALLPIVCTLIAKWGFEDFDNRQPRQWLSRQQGWRARANAAQANSWEAFTVFSASLFVAHLAHAPQTRVDAIALAFIAARSLYIVFYLADQALLRSLIWVVGFGLCVSLFVVGI